MAVALFLLTTVDMVTTIYAAAVVGRGAESNPLVRWVLHQGLAAFAVTNLLAVVLAVVLFYGVVEMIRASPPRFDRYSSICKSLHSIPATQMRWTRNLRMAGGHE